MKKQALIKNGVMASLLVAGMNLTTSCESCSRKDTNTETTKYVTDTDTVYVDSSSSDTGNSGTGGASGSGTKRSSPASGTSGSSSSTSSSAGSSSTASSTSKGKKLTEEEITDEIENSSKTARDANGKPINSGGTSGTGMGTGTGSTGNNSRVSKPEDQKGN